MGAAGNHLDYTRIRITVGQSDRSHTTQKHIPTEALLATSVAEHLITDMVAELNRHVRKLAGLT